MEYYDTGVSQGAIGIPTEEERKKLEEKYTFMGSHISSKPGESYELWLKNLKGRTSKEQ